MSISVKVVDANFHVVNLKVNPGTPMINVLENACAKFRLPSDEYTLKHKSKLVELSNPWRTTGFPSGAKLELIQKSKSPTVVYIALQLPDTLAAGGRLTAKFASTTTAWAMLRYFESEAAGAPPSMLNLTDRSVAQTDSGAASGHGQLMYETPVLNIMGREVAGLEALTRTLSQLGLGAGSHLIRLSFKVTGESFFEAQRKTAEFFKDDVVKMPEEKTRSRKEDEASTAAQGASPSMDNMSALPAETATSPAHTQETQPGAPQENQEAPASTKPTDQAAQSMDLDPPEQATASSPSLPPQRLQLVASTLPSIQPAAPEQGPPHLPQASSTSSSFAEPIAVFAAPSSSTPHAATLPTKDDDFVPTVAHAQLHQSMLQKRAQNLRLKSDDELAHERAQRTARLDAIPSIDVKVRFPDNSAAVWRFDPTATAATVYNAVRRALTPERAAADGFRLLMPARQGPLPDADGPAHRLIAAYKFGTGVTLNLVWEDSVRAQARSQPLLNELISGRAVPVPVPEIPEEHAEPIASSSSAGLTQGDDGAAGGKAGHEGGGGKKLPKWLKLPGRK